MSALWTSSCTERGHKYVVIVDVDLGVSAKKARAGAFPHSIHAVDDFSIMSPSHKHDIQSKHECHTKSY